MIERHKPKDQDELVGDIKDVITGWCAPMTDRERLECIGRLLDIPEDKWAWGGRDK